MRDYQLTVKKNTKVTDGVFRLDLESETEIEGINAGQFLNLEVPDKTMLLRRPFCIYNHEKHSLSTFIAEVGKGTSLLSQSKMGDKLMATLPLGNGFDISNYKKIGLLGGGMGSAELYLVTADKTKEFYAYLGFANKNRVMFTDDFKSRCKKVEIYTRDGSYGKQGYSTEGLLKDIDSLDAVLICGSPAMLKSIQESLKNRDIPAFASTEQRMACGVGACLVCNCKTTHGYKRVCKDGPVFSLKELVL